MKTDDQTKGMGWSMLLAMWVLIFIMLAWFFSKVLDQQNNPNQSVSSNRISNSQIEVVLQRNRFGHYVADGEINGEQVEFMLDTGATGVIVPANMASKLGIEKGESVTVHTANGTIKAYAVKLDRVAIGEISLTDVKAMINPKERSEVVLLGMSFLKYIEFTQRGDILILRQNVNDF